jgi:hypothetical protein
MGWGEPTTPPSTWTGQADARIAELEQQVAERDHAYQVLWHRHQAILRRIRDLTHLNDQNPDLPSPHELRTGHTRQHVIRSFNETTE